MNRNKVISNLNGLVLKNHISYIYEEKKGQLTVASLFMGIGFKRKERCVYIIDDNSIRSLEKAMKTAGTDVSAETRSGNLIIWDKNDIYLKDGEFNVKHTLDRFGELYGKTEKEGYRGLRIASEMTWALGDEKSLEKLIDYEILVNSHINKYNIIAMCQYNLARFDHNTIKDVIFTHPYVIYKNSQILYKSVK
ncbi:MAG: MEDS domain-containing protein [Elusimicrobia bacterium]|nr:MEDS domain-containing protein [Elusimicrobiota bacterium]